MAQWLGLLAFTAVAPGSVPGQGTEIHPASLAAQPKKKKFPFICVTVCSNWRND